MWGNNRNNYGGGGGMQECLTDNLIQNFVPGGLNSPLGETIDNMIGGNQNPTSGQIQGGAPGVGGFDNMGGGYHHQGGF
ncbi:unnamed protein product [Rotaria sp. Silwood1]|nr:unnamed protein product [Rotaria sp. Silwood1]CAF4799767.1 unnamed protein product [Rotaria sp. Silwood1]